MPWKGPMQMGGSEAEASLAYGEHSSEFLTSHRCGFESGLRHLAALRARRRLVLVFMPQLYIKNNDNLCFTEVCKY